MTSVSVVDVFSAGPGGGNPAPVVVDASAMTDAAMQQVARSTGHESAFVIPVPAGSHCDVALRFWVPNHEMPMCGHATIGAIWLLDRLGIVNADAVDVWTQSGTVTARIDRSDPVAVAVEISQPEGVVEPVGDVAEIASVLGISAADIDGALNSRTSRVKTLVRIASVEKLHALKPDFARIEALCSSIGSTGLYAWAATDAAASVFEARQFPQSSGYDEDPATGIAAAALAYGLLELGAVSRDSALRIRQGTAMGRPSEIRVRFADDGCWISGRAELADTHVG